MASFHFELVSPERLLMAASVQQVDLPGADGDFGVLAGHAPLMAALRPGVATIKGEGAPERVFLSGGFADVSPTSLTVLAEKAIPLAEVKSDRLAAEIKDAEEDLADAKTAEAKSRAETKLAELRHLESALKD